ncbi:MAG: hypothetical protein JWO71_2929 [Candidatus Acidoferrum typicum]|nr:hypothetical protein [Candidatus Acidoferrum typicum]
MKQSPSEADNKWEGFELTSYHLDSERILNLPLKERRSSDAKADVDTTVGDVYRRVLDRFDQLTDNCRSIDIVSGNGRLSVAGPEFNCSMLLELLRIRKGGFDPFCAEWFFYADDSSRDSLHHNLYEFFVVYIDKIIRERVFFSDHDESGFNPLVFQTDNKFRGGWVNEWASREARTHFWFQKFYSNRPDYGSSTRSAQTFRNGNKATPASSFRKDI